MINDGEEDLEDIEIQKKREEDFEEFLGKIGVDREWFGFISQRVAGFQENYEDYIESGDPSCLRKLRELIKLQKQKTSVPKVY